MVLALFGFLNLSFADVLDILLVAFIIYQVFKWIRGSSAMSIFMAILFLYVFRVLVDVLDMRLMSAIMGTVLDVGVIALIVIFQPEIRRFLITFGSRYKIATNGKGFLSKLFGGQDARMDTTKVNEIAEACKSMSETKTGALIVIPHSDNLDDIISTGDIINADISRRLIMNLFFKNSPLHDGAVVIDSEHIVAARCTLPITEKVNIPPSFGMRHKAAIGISEEKDVDVVVVSEETGRISFVKGGNVTPIKNINELKLLLGSSLTDNAAGGKVVNAPSSGNAPASGNGEDR